MLAEDDRQQELVDDDEWSSELTLAHRCSPCFGACSLREFCGVNLEWSLPCFSFAQRGSLVNSALFAHESLLRCPCHASVKSTLVKPSLEHLQSLLIWFPNVLIFTLHIWNFPLTERSDSRKILTTTQYRQHW